MTVLLDDFVETKELAQSDARGRVTLGAIARDKRYSIAISPSGDILLTPVVAVPERELWLHRNPTALAMVDRGIADAEAGRTTSLADVLEEAKRAAEEAPR
jgi:hypothetical protein